MSFTAPAAENLNDLPFLNEPEILSCLKKRYLRDQIYTYTGKILIALNPFKQLPGLYSDELLASFFSTVETRLPHIWGIASSAYHRLLEDMELSMSTSYKISNYAILISGESGSGKTESCKYLLKHLTRAGSTDISRSCQSLSTDTTMRWRIMDQIMDSNPILEAFGNSKTMRNSNSSRFGKFIQLRFNEEGSIIGGLIQTYLLENVRVVNQQVGERNFHIFTHLICGANETERSRWQLKPTDRYQYLNYHSELNVVVEKAKLMNLKESFLKLNFESDVVGLVLDIAAGILHIGQIRFESVGDSSGDVANIVDRMPLMIASRLCGFTTEELESALTIRTVISRGEEFRKKLSKVHAIGARDAVAKVVYNKMFAWLVNAINKNIDSNRNSYYATIGILDIFGFECFEKNSFEQLCINYANESLQMQFNNTVFELELSEYKREGIRFNIAYTSNQESLDLIGIHIFKILDDQCKLPNATDERFSSQLYKDLINKPRFIATKKEQRDCQFTIMHFAGPVQYSTSRFTEKNVDDLPPDITLMLQHSLNSILSSTNECSSTDDVAAAANPHRKGKISVSCQFRNQLNELMTKLNDTTPFYVRCIKPIDADKAALSRTNKSDCERFNDVRVSEQLNNGGVFVAMKVARAGYSVRLSFYDFYCRYRFVANGYAHSKLPHIPKQRVTREDCSHLSSLLLDIVKRKADKKDTILSDSIQVGQTKIFLQQIYFNLLEKLKSHIIHASATRIERFCKAHLRAYGVATKNILAGKVSRITALCRKFIGRCRYLRLRSAVVLLQCVIRFRRVYRRKRASLVITKYIKAVARWNSFLKYLETLPRARRPKKKIPSLSVDPSDPTTEERFIPSFEDSPPVKKASSADNPDLRDLRNTAAKAQTCGSARKIQSSPKVFRRPKQLKGTSAFLSNTPPKKVWSPIQQRVAKTTRQQLVSKFGYIASYNDVLNCRAEYQLAVCAELHRVLSVVGGGTTKSPILALDIHITKELLGDAAKLIPKGPLRSSLQQISATIDFGYNLLDGEEVIDLKSFGKIINFFTRNKPEKWTYSAKYARKSLGADHKVFKRIYETIRVLKELKESAQDYLTQLPHFSEMLISSYEEGERNYGECYASSYFDKLQFDLKELQRVGEVATKVSEVADMLVSYYYEYIAVVVMEYGDSSLYKCNFPDEISYICDLTKKLSSRQKLLRGEMKDTTAAAKEHTVPALLALDKTGSNTFLIKAFTSTGAADNNRTKGEAIETVVPLVPPKTTATSLDFNCAKYTPYAPGVEFSFNFLLRILADEVNVKSSGRVTNIHVIKTQSNQVHTREYTNELLMRSRYVQNRSEAIVKLIGQRDDGTQQRTLYQLSPLFSIDNLNDVLASEETLKSITHRSFSSVVITCLLFGVLHAKPENFIVRFTKGKRKSSCVQLDGLNIDKELAENLFSYHMREHLFGLNVIFFLPQMDDIVDKSLVYLMTRSNNMPEKIMCLWLREIRVQNIKYERLVKSSGLTAEDLEELKLPIRFPPGTAVILYNRLQTICKLLRTKSHCSHRKLMHALYPSLLQFYEPRKRDPARVKKAPLGERNPKSNDLTLTVQQTYYTALTHFHKESHYVERRPLGSRSAEFGFEDIFPLRSLSIVNYDRESVLTELSSARKSTLFDSCQPDALIHSHSHSHSHSHDENMKPSQSTSRSKSIDLQSIYCHILGRRNDLNVLQPLKTVAANQSLSSSSGRSSRDGAQKIFSNAKNMLSSRSGGGSFDMGDIYSSRAKRSDETLVMEPFVNSTLMKYSKAFRDENGKRKIFEAEVFSPRKRATQLPSSTARGGREVGGGDPIVVPSYPVKDSVVLDRGKEESLDFGDIYASMVAEDNITMDPTENKTLKRFSEAFGEKKKTMTAMMSRGESLFALPTTEESKVPSAAAGVTKKHERIKEFMFDPQVDFGDIYSEEQAFEMTAKEVVSNPANSTMKATPIAPTSGGGLPVKTHKEKKMVAAEAEESPFQQFSQIEQLSVEFLTNLDFSELRNEDGLAVCQMIGQCFSFIETVCLYKVNEEQLSAIYGSWLAGAVPQKSSADKRYRLDVNDLPKVLKTKKIVLVGLNRKMKHSLKCSNIYFDLKNKLGINVRFYAHDDASNLNVK